VALRRVLLQIVFAVDRAERARQLGKQSRIVGPPSRSAWRVRAPSSQQPGVLELFHIRQVAERFEAELRQERRRGDTGVRRAGLGLRGPAAVNPVCRSAAMVSRLTSATKNWPSSPRVPG
jgi:hypothetical protein